MQSSNIPAKFPTPFAASATAGYIRTIPTTSGDPTVASLALGFPPNTATPIGAGGTPPNIQDFNGLLYQITAWCQWQAAGGAFPPYDGTFQAAIGGYPKGAVVASATTAGKFWLSTAENNTTNPDASGAGWVSFGNPGTVTAVSDATNGGLNVATGTTTPVLSLKPSDLLTKSSPTASDLLMIGDAAASFGPATTTVAQLISSRSLARKVVSPALTFPQLAGTTAQWAHGLGVRPDYVAAMGRNINTEGGYTTGQMVQFPNASFAWNGSANVTNGAGVYWDSTNCNIVIANGVSQIDWFTTTGGTFNPSAANWSLVFVAYY